MNNTCLWIGIVLMPILLYSAYSFLNSLRYTVEWSLLRPLERIAQRLFEIESQLRLANHHRQLLRNRAEELLRTQGKE